MLLVITFFTNVFGARLQSSVVVLEVTLLAVHSAFRAMKTEFTRSVLAALPAVHFVAPSISQKKAVTFLPVFPPLMRRYH